MALTCILFMVLGFVMAKRYVISQKVNQQVQKFLACKRENKLDQLSAAEQEEYEQLHELLS